MKKEIFKPNNKTYSVACDPLADVYHILETETNQVTTTGLPVIVVGLTKQEVYDKIFQTWEEITEEDNTEISYTKKDFDYSVGYTLEEANETANDANEILTNVVISPIKHPDREEYAIVFDSEIFNSAHDVDKKNKLYNKHIDKINQGQSKKISTLKSEGW